MTITDRSTVDLARRAGISRLATEARAEVRRLILHVMRLIVCKTCESNVGRGCQDSACVWRAAWRSIRPRPTHSPGYGVEEGAEHADEQVAHGPRQHPVADAVVDAVADEAPVHILESAVTPTHTTLDSACPVRPTPTDVASVLPHVTRSGGMRAVMVGYGHNAAFCSA